MVPKGVVKDVKNSHGMPKLSGKLGSDDNARTFFKGLFNSTRLPTTPNNVPTST